MAVSYKKLLKLPIDRDMKRKELAEKAGISPTLGSSAWTAPTSAICSAFSTVMLPIRGISSVLMWRIGMYTMDVRHYLTPFRNRTSNEMYSGATTFKPSLYNSNQDIFK